MSNGMEIVGQYGGGDMSADEMKLASIVHGWEVGDFGDEIIGAVGPLASRVAATRRPIAARIVQRYNTAAQTAQNRAAPISVVRPNFTGPTAPGGATVQSVGLGPIREVQQGLDSGAVLVAAGAQSAIVVNVTMAFRPTRLMVGPTIAPLWVIDDLRVGPDSLFLGAPGAAPAENFLPNAVTASALKRKTAQGGTPITVLATNIDAVAHRFRASLFGEAADAAQCGS
jgi:hypothetical protein